MITITYFLQPLLFLSLVTLVYLSLLTHARHLPPHPTTVRAAASSAQDTDDDATSILVTSGPVAVASTATGDDDSHSSSPLTTRKKPKPCKKCFGGGDDDDDDFDFDDDDDDDDDDDFFQCFPASALVRLSASQHLPISLLRSGDVITLADDKQATIYGFSHRDQHVRAQFLTFTTAAGNLTATRGHYVYARLKHSDQTALYLAKQLSVGDSLVHFSKGLQTITKTETVIMTGLYNPHATQDELVVDGFRVSTFTQAVPPQTAVSLLAPMRALFKAIPIDTLTTALTAISHSLR